MAQPQTTGNGFIASQKEKIDDIARQTQQLASQLEEKAGDDTGLVQIRVELEKLARDLLASGVAFRPRISEINDRLEQLGPERAEGEPAEPELVQQERQRLLDEKAEINALIGEAEALSLRINRMIEQIAQMRRDLFTSALSRRYDITAALSPQVLNELHTDLGKAYDTVASWLRFTASFKLRALLLTVFFSLAAALVLHLAGRRLFGNLIDPDLNEAEPTYLSRLSLALWSTLLPSAAFGILLGSAYFFLDVFGILRRDIAELLWPLFSVAVVVFFVYRLALAVLAPKRENWRLLPVETSAAGKLCLLVGVTATVTGFDFFMNRLYELFGSQLSLTVATSFLATIVVGVLLILIGSVKPFPGEEGARPRPWPIIFRVLIYGFAAATIIAALFGYIGFSRFLSQQVVVTGAILATMYIGFLAGGAMSGDGAFAGSAVGRLLSRRFSLDATTLDQLGLVAGLATNVAVVLVGAPLILLQWGFHWAELTAWTYGIANKVSIGNISFSLVGILSGLLVFIVGYFVARWFQAWLDSRVMARSRLDTGVRNSVRTAIGYAGVVVAALFGVATAGIDLSNLALVASALSVGIGFGLRNILENFVSGLILLVERPFKAGDWIVAGAVSGTVKKISVRATEIETFQRQTVILPNSELINAAVGNWTHKNSLGRVEIPIGVAYGTDVKKVHAILLDIAQSNRLVLKNPEPFVLFAGFGDSSLDFEIRVYLADILAQLEVQNEIRFAIVEAFEREGIEIPFPQRDIHFRSGPSPSGAGASGSVDGESENEEDQAESG
ncbi:mechanosensitive ion channel domain-containing protein [Nitratireductor luteus]|uniref:mechanosensitive ion channel domain-containing protein n=1 Tax=Nitratireductor luteus TaxID=2976980 RepID=UPI00224061D1|nr:mechanosensitive ion channel domain-containing protein [Nitratireductor luteus]